MTKDDELFELGVPGPLRDRLVAAVMAGVKVATSSLRAQYDAEKEPLPIAGDEGVMIDSQGAPVARIVVTEVSIIHLGDADDRLAIEEGEGFHTAAEWREAHEAFWEAEVLPHLEEQITLDDDTEVVVERFTVTEPRPPAS